MSTFISVIFRDFYINFLRISVLCYFTLAKLVADFVVLDACVSFDPVPGDIKAEVECIKCHPEVLVFDRFFVCSAPAFSFPAFDPGCDAVFYVLTVGIKADRAGFELWSVCDCA